MGLRGRQSADDRATHKAIAQPSCACRPVWTPARMSDDGEPIYTEVVGQLCNIAFPRLIAARRVEGAVPITRTVRCDQPHTLARGDVRLRRKEAARPRRAMERVQPVPHQPAHTPSTPSRDRPEARTPACSCTDAECPLLRVLARAPRRAAMSPERMTLRAGEFVDVPRTSEQIEASLCQGLGFGRVGAASVVWA